MLAVSFSPFFSLASCWFGVVAAGGKGQYRDDHKNLKLAHGVNFFRLPAKGDGKMQPRRGYCIGRFPVWQLIAPQVKMIKMHRMRNMFFAAVIALAAPAQGGAVMQHVTGRFDVKITPEASDSADGAALGRMLVEKQFFGPLTAQSRGEMLTGTTAVEGSAAYVLIERVTGSLDGKAGGFMLAHIGIMDRGKPDLRVIIVPDSGSGALKGLSGSLIIRIECGAHFYELDYRLAPQ